MGDVNVDLPAELLFTVEEMVAIDVRRKEIHVAYLAQIADILHK